MARFEVPVVLRADAAPTAIALLLFAIGQAHATSLALYPAPPGAMKPSEIRQTFAGQEFDGVYPPDGDKWSETYRADGSLNYFDAAGGSTGGWSVNGDRFCTRYDKASLVSTCFLIRQRSDNCFDFYEVGKDFRPTASAKDVRRGANYSARAWRRSEASTCPAVAERAGLSGE